MVCAEQKRLGGEAATRELLKRESAKLVADKTDWFERDGRIWSDLAGAQCEIGDKPGGRATYADVVKRARTIVKSQLRLNILENMIYRQIQTDETTHVHEAIVECCAAVEASREPRDVELKEWRKIELMIWDERFAEAFAAIQKFTDQDVRQGRTRANLFMFLAEQLKTDQAARAALKMDLGELIQEAKAAATASRDNQALVVCGFCLAQFGKFEEARESLLGADNVADPNIRKTQAAGLIELAERQIKAAKREDAIASARSAADITRGFVDELEQELYMSLIVDTIRIAGDLDAALETLEEQSETASGFDPKNAWLIVDALIAAGRNRDAAKLLSRALIRAEANLKESLRGLKPAGIIAWRSVQARAAVLAELLFRSNEKDKAFQTFDRLSKVSVRDDAKAAFAEFRAAPATSRPAVARSSRSLPKPEETKR